MHQACEKELQDAFKRILDRQWFVLGQEVEGFEQAYAQWLGVQYAVGVGNGLDALTIGLSALSIGKGDEVLVPALTFVACFHAVQAVGARPVPIEVDEHALIAPDKIAASLTPQTKAIMAVHLYGKGCDMEALRRIAEHHKIAIIEDNAQAHGTIIGNTKTGCFGSLSAGSFYPTKNLGALGDGGIICTNDHGLFVQCRALRNYGSTEKYKIEQFGYNSRLDELQAAFLQVKLPHLDTWNAERIRQAEVYHEGLKHIEEVRLPALDTEGRHVYHIYAIRGANRNGLRKHLQAKGIATLIHYPIPIHLQPAYRSLRYTAGAFPVAERIANTTLSLPIYPGLSLAEQQRVIGAIGEFYSKKSR